MKDKAAVVKSKTTGKEKEREKQAESTDTQLNTAMPYWTLRVVSDVDAAVSLLTSLIYSRNYIHCCFK